MLPIPRKYEHASWCVRAWLLHTTAGEDVGLCGVHSDAADVVGVGLEHVSPGQRVVVKHTDLHVILGGGRDRD